MADRRGLGRRRGHRAGSWRDGGGLLTWGWVPGGGGGSIGHSDPDFPFELVSFLLGNAGNLSSGRE